MLLRTWDDEYSSREKTVTVLREPARYQQSESFGLDERIVHLKALWAGDIAGYTVIATVKNRDAHPREIKEYRDDAVYSISRLAVRADGGLVAVLGQMVPVQSLREHALQHRTEAGDGPFPVDEALRTGLSTDSYQQKVPAIRDWLIEVCRGRGTVTYSDVMNRFALSFYPLRNAMSRLGHDCKDAGEPIITAVIVDKETGRCSQGLFDEFRVDDDELERQRCYSYWGSDQSVAPTDAMAPLRHQGRLMHSRRWKPGSPRLRSDRNSKRSERLCFGHAAVSAWSADATYRRRSKPRIWSGGIGGRVTIEPSMECCFVETFTRCTTEGCCAFRTQESLN
jgi:hypothetical protein